MMNINIISYSDSQLANLPAEQIESIKRAQDEKNDLEARYAKYKERERYKLVRQGTYRSTIYDSYCEKMDAELADRIEKLRASLLFLLVYTNYGVGSNEGYTVDYSLDLESRFNIVKNYYNSNYPNAKAKFSAFSLDRVAPVYLGENYSVLFNLYAADAR